MKLVPDGADFYLAFDEESYKVFGVDYPKKREDP